MLVDLPGSSGKSKRHRCLCFCLTCSDIQNAILCLPQQLYIDRAGAEEQPALWLAELPTLHHNSMSCLPNKVPTRWRKREAEHNRKTCLSSKVPARHSRWGSARLRWQLLFTCQGASKGIKLRAVADKLPGLGYLPLHGMATDVGTALIGHCLPCNAFPV